MTLTYTKELREEILSIVTKGEKNIELNNDTTPVLFSQLDEIEKVGEDNIFPINLNTFLNTTFNSIAEYSTVLELAFMNEVKTDDELVNLLYDNGLVKSEFVPDDDRPFDNSFLDSLDNLEGEDIPLIDDEDLFGAEDDHEDEDYLTIGDVVDVFKFYLSEGVEASKRGYKRAKPKVDDFSGFAVKRTKEFKDFATEKLSELKELNHNEVVMNDEEYSKYKEFTSGENMPEMLIYLSENPEFAAKVSKLFDPSAKLVIKR